MLEFLKKIPLTFYSGAFYSNLIRGEEGIGVGFIFLLVAINFLGILIPVAPAIYGIGGKIQQVAMTLPVTTIKNGKISIDKPTPYQIAFPSSKAGTDKADTSQFIVIDPNYTNMNLDSLVKKMQSEHIILLLTADKVVTRGSNGEVKIDPLRTMPDAVITQEKWEQFGTLISDLLLPLMAIMILIGLIIKNFVGVFCGAVIAKIVSFFSIPGFAGAMRLAAAASVPSAILFALIQRPMFWGSFLVWLAYAIFGIWNYRKTGIHS